jgi:integrase
MNYPVVYHCPICDKYMDHWKTRDGWKAKCKACDKTYWRKDLIPMRRNPYYVQKRSLKRLDSVTSAITRTRLLQIINSCDDLRTQALYATLFITGGRCQEIVRYKPKGIKKKYPSVKKFNFIDGEYSTLPVYWIKGLRLLKMRGTEPAVRPDLPISYKIDKKFIYYIKAYLSRLEPEEELFPFSYSYANRLIKDNGDLFPHLLRDLRYYDLNESYGWDTEKRLKFFGWKSLDTTMHYSKLRPVDLISPQNF